MNKEGFAIHDQYLDLWRDRESCYFLRHTAVIQMFAPLEIPMAPCRDVKIPLDLVSLQTAINSTGAPRISPSQPGRLSKLFLLADHLSQHVPHMSVLLQLGFHLTGLLQSVQSSLGIHPLHPTSRVLYQHVAGENAVATGVLDIYVQIIAGHGDYYVEVDLKVMRDAFFHAKQVGFMPAIPTTEFCEGKQE